MAGLRPSQKDVITNTRERILSIGGANMGKSFSYYSIARLSATTGSDAKFYIVDTDESVGRMLSDPEFNDLWLPDGSGLVNIEFTAVNSWDTLMAAIAGYQEKMRNQDWLMIDMVSPSYQWVQDWFVRRVYHKGLDEFFLQHRESLKPTDKSKGAMDGWKDWPVIKGEYGNLKNRILRCPGNLYCTAEAKSMNSDFVDKQTKMMFGPYGIVPVGESQTPHLFSTILWMTSTIPGQREIITIKDRSRAELNGEVVDDFAKDYLVKVAGWSTGKTAAEALAEAKAKKQGAAA